MGEKRKYMRFNVFLDAICRTGGALKKLKINNFSKEGVGILSEEIFGEGEDLEIEMMIPGDNIPVLFHGKVAWADATGSDNTQNRGGLKFETIKNEDRGKILEYIYQKWIMPAKKDDK